ncbi:carbohydrate binding domain-containing protein [Streptomyces sp. NPDC001530]|uniref:carbohydrate binding domain-containing protein n=1 Tax=Streptomyces sp. NPDC001530 TaxID=3364582 RepID=UPI0036B19CE7
MARIIAEVGFGYTVTSALPVWTTITEYVDMAAGISLNNRGASDERADTQPGTMSLTLDNSDGRFTPNRSGSPYYPNVKRNVPIRLRVVSADMNLITNPGFESGLTDWDKTASPTIAQDATHVKHGSQAMRVTWGAPAGQAVFTDVYGLDIGETYTVSAHVWVPTGAPAVFPYIVGMTVGNVSTLNDQWQKLTYTFTATATQHRFLLQAAGTPTAGTQCWIDAVQLWEGSSAVPLNHVVNPDFETDTSGWTSSGTPTITQSTAQAQRGTGSMLTTWGAVSSQSVRTTVNGLDIGATYTASAYVRVPAGDQAVRLKMATSGGTDFAFGSYSTLNDTWQQITCTFTATETSAQLRINPNTPTGAGDLVYVDTVQVQQGSTAAPFTTLDGAQIHPRFYGMVNNWPVTWSGLQSKVSITCTDLFKWVGINRQLLPMLNQEILLDRPTAYFPLSEAAGSTTAGDISGTAGVGTLSVTQAGTGGTLDFDSGTGPTGDGLGCPTFTPSSTSNGKYLSADLGQNFVDANLFFRVRAECWFTTSTNGRVLMALASTDASTRLTFLLESGTGKLAIEKDQGGFGTQTYVFATPNLADGALHHMAYSEFENLLYIDGVSYSLVSFQGTDLRMLTVGGYQNTRLWSGTISQLAIYCRSITAAELAAHYTTGTTENVGEAADVRMSRLASYVGLTVTTQGTAFDAMASQAALGRTALEHMREIEMTESGKLLASRSGAALVFQSRNLRYNPVPALSLDYADLDTDGVEYAHDDQKQVNDVEATRSGGATQRVTNQASIDTYGPYKQPLELFKTNDNSVLDAANWLVSRYADPPPEIRQVPVDAFTLPLASYRTLLNADVSTTVTLTDLPDQAPSATATVVIDGYTETIGLSKHHLDFYTSRAQTDSVWILDDPVFSVLDSTTRLAY